MFFFFFSSRRRHTRSLRDWSSDVCSSDLWATSDRASIDQALSEAMSDAALNEIMGQYFGGTSPTTTALQSRALTQPQPARFDQASVNTVITQLLGSGALDGLDLATSVVNLL